jgi:hypothetical protein
MIRSVHLWCPIYLFYLCAIKHCPSVGIDSQIVCRFLESDRMACTFLIFAGKNRMPFAFMSAVKSLLHANLAPCNNAAEAHVLAPATKQQAHTR